MISFEYVPNLTLDVCRKPYAEQIYKLHLVNFDTEKIRSKTNTNNAGWITYCSASIIVKQATKL